MVREDGENRELESLDLGTPSTGSGGDSVTGYARTGLGTPLAICGDALRVSPSAFSLLSLLTPECS